MDQHSTPPDRRIDQFLQPVLWAHARRVMRFRFWILVLTALLALPALLATVGWIRFENSLEVWFSPDDPAMVRYKEFIDCFGGDEFYGVAFEHPEPLSLSALLLVDELSKTLEQIPHTTGVLSPTSIARKMAKQGLSLPFDLDSVLSKKQPIEPLSHWIRTYPPAGKIFVNETEGSLLVVGGLPKLSIQEKHEVATEIETALESLGNRNHTRFYSAGTPLLDTAFDLRTQRDTFIFLPAITFVIICFLLGIFRRLSLVFLGLLVIGISFCISVGLYNFQGNTFNVSTGILPPLILAITVAYSVHIMVHYQEELSRGLSQRKALEATIVHMWEPCLFTSLTTMAGFLSFIFMDVSAIRSVGIYTAVGIGSAFVLSTTFLPAALSYLKPPKIPEPGNSLLQSADFFLGGLLEHLARWNQRFRWPLFLGMFPVAILSFLGILRLDSQTYGLEFFKHSDPIHQGYTFIEKNFGGITALEFVAHGPPGTFYRLDTIETIDAWCQNSLENYKEVTDARSMSDLVKGAHQAASNWNPDRYLLPENPFVFQGTMASLKSLAGKELTQYLGPRGERTRATLIIKASGTQRVTQIIHEVQEDLQKRLGPDIEVSRTGIVPLYISMDVRLLRSQMISFSIAFGVVFVLMALLLRDFKLATISMIPNLLPIVVTLGLMGWVGIPLDVATIMIAGAALGICVDDTIHYLARYARELKKDLDPVGAMHRTHRTVGRALTFTSLILFAGFGTLCLGSFIPTIALGSLTALTMVLAVLGDLVLLPVVLLILRPFRSSQPDSPQTKEIPQ
ncbi:MAG: efflux RND transporter permease subunit [Planctomycetota bacterium]|nr:efflux RND transporter permease subunit [Planctomycetota bacterium]